MNLKVTKGPFGTTVQFTDATVEEVDLVLGLLGLLSPEIQSQATEPQEPEKAFVGQRLSKSDWENWPPGIRVVQEAENSLGRTSGATFLGFDRSGIRASWYSSLDRARVNAQTMPWQKRYQAAMASTTDTMVVQEVW